MSVITVHRTRHSPDCFASVRFVVQRPFLLKCEGSVSKKKISEPKLSHTRHTQNKNTKKHKKTQKNTTNNAISVYF